MRLIIFFLSISIASSPCVSPFPCYRCSYPAARQIAISPLALYKRNQPQVRNLSQFLWLDWQRGETWRHQTLCQIGPAVAFINWNSPKQRALLTKLVPDSVSWFWILIATSLSFENRSRNGWLAQILLLNMSNHGAKLIKPFTEGASSDCEMWTQLDTELDHCKQLGWLNLYQTWNQTGLKNPQIVSEP